MDRMGLGYENLKKIKPDIIMVSASLQGQTGPHSTQPGFGTELAALAGITNLIHWPHRIPLGTSNPYTDYMVPQYAIAAIVAALEHRQKTGRGQHIDLAQLELGAFFLSLAVFTDEEGHAFCHVMRNPPWTKEARFATLMGRRTRTSWSG